MGADFNILEYADPELDNITGGGKANILDLDLEPVEVETKEEKQKKDIKEEEDKSDEPTTTSHPDINEATKLPTDTTPTNPVSTQVQMMTATPPVPQPITTTTIMSQSPHPQAAVVQQQMHQHVQQAAAMGRPMPPGTRLLSPDGAVGVVTSTNTVTVSYPNTFPGHPQKLAQTHVQGERTKTKIHKKAFIVEILI